jgi:hypothetical protein
MASIQYSNYEYYRPDEKKINITPGCSHSLYPHAIARYQLDHYTQIPNSNKNKKIGIGNSQLSYNKTVKSNISKRREDNFNPSQNSTSVDYNGTNVNINLQKSLGKFETKNGGYNSQRELRGIVEIESHHVFKHGNHIFSGYTLF